jgi:hypothetical protein
MEGKKLLGVLLIAGALLGALVAGCGSGGSDTSSDSSSPASTSESSTADDSTSSSDETGASAEFIKPGGKAGGNKEIAEFGQEGDDAEREAASAVLEENLEARASGDWAGQCSSLAAEAIASLAKAPEAGGGPCEKSLETLAQPIAKTKLVRANTMTEPVAALRVEGNRAFALYHGTNGVNYVMPMNKDGGEWKVGAIQEQKLP